MPPDKLPPPDSDRSPDPDTERWLAVLRSGTRLEKIEARRQLASIFELRDQVEDAVELLENNVRAGVRDPVAYAHLASLYRRMGLDDIAEEALAEASKLETAQTEPVRRAIEPSGPVPPPAPPAARPAPADPVPGLWPARQREPGEPERPAARLDPAVTMGRRSARPPSPAVGPDRQRSGLPAGLGLGPLIAVALVLVAVIAVLGLAVVAFSPLFRAAPEGVPAPAPLDPGTRPSPGPSVAIAAAATPATVRQPGRAPTAGSTGEANCSFQFGFETLRQLLGADVVGDCLENQVSPDAGFARQRTTNGELVWREADNWTAFTNGRETWVLGPDGLQKQ